MHGIHVLLAGLLITSIGGCLAPESDDPAHATTAPQAEEPDTTQSTSSSATNLPKNMTEQFGPLIGFDAPPEAGFDVCSAPTSACARYPFQSDVDFVMDGVFAINTMAHDARFLILDGEGNIVFEPIPDRVERQIYTNFHLPEDVMPAGEYEFIVSANGVAGGVLTADFSAA